MYTDTVAIIGAGNGGYAMAGDLASRGYKIKFYEHPNFKDNFTNILNNKKIVVIEGEEEKTVDITVATTDIKEALYGVKIVNLVVPSTVQKNFFKEIARGISKGQIVVVWAGRFGSVEFLSFLKKNHIDFDFVIVETDTLPYGARMIGPQRVNILYRSLRLYVSSIPADRKEEAKQLLGEMFEGVKVIDNVLAVAFSNPALLVYGEGALLNVARIQHTKGNFYLFKEGITDAVAEVMYKAYSEITAVTNSLGFKIPVYLREDFDGPTSLEGACFKSLQGNQGFKKMNGPSSINGRYMMENIGDALVPITELGKIGGIDTPVLDSIITLSSIICKVNFRKEGRNLARLGLTGMNQKEIINTIVYGL